MRYSTWQRLLIPVLLVSSLIASCGKDNPAPAAPPPQTPPPKIAGGGDFAYLCAHKQFS